MSVPKLVLLVLWIIQSGLVLGQSVDSPAALRSKVDSIAQWYVEAYEIPGLSIGVRAGNASFAAGYGVKLVGTKYSVTANTVFHTASISKVFTALGIMQLVQAKKLDLNTRVTAIIPDLKFTDPAINDITVGHLLNHSSGLPDIINYGWGKKTNESRALRSYFSKKKLRVKFQPGSDILYSNLGYDLLGLVAEEIAGRNFSDYQRGAVLRPYGMSGADYAYPEISGQQRVRPHTKHWLSQRVRARKTYPYNPAHAPSSTLNASANDLLTWMTKFLSEEDDVLLPATKNRMTGTDSTMQRATGFQQFTFAGNPLIGHYGGDRGFRSFLLLDVQRKIGLVLLANCDYHEDFRSEILFAILAEIDALERE